MKFSAVFSVAVLVGFSSALPINPRASNVESNVDARSLDPALFKRATVPKVTTPKVTTPKIELPKINLPTLKTTPQETKVTTPTTKKEDPAPTTKVDSKTDTAKPTTTTSKTASSASPSASSCPKKRADNAGSNDCDDPSLITLKTVDKKDVKFKLGAKLGAGTNGRVYEINCGTDATCKAMGSVVVKEYNSDGQYEAPGERKALEKISELKASGNHGGKEYTVMVKQDGVILGKTTAYTNTKSDSPERKQLVEDAIKLATADGTDYINKFGIKHNDNHGQNVLFKETGGKLTSAKVIDWDDSEDVSGSKDAAIKALGDEMRTAFELFLKD